MSSMSIQSLLLASAVVLTPVLALDQQLVGTWSTKSAKVFTGPGFYNPINDSFIEPSRTGISYSFTADGFYESAYYRAIANPQDPSCPGSIMQFQHGTVVMNQDLSLSLTPIAVDGRQLQSDPCHFEHGLYTRYNQTETMKKWQVYIDPYTKMTRLDLYGHDGAKIHPLFLAYSPPQMLPTVTMNPTAAAPTATGKVKRAEGEREVEQYDSPLNLHAHHVKREHRGLGPHFTERISLNAVWWTGVGMCLFGGAAYLL